MQYTRRLLTGLSTFVPGVARLSERVTGGSNSALYCYWVWLRHLIMAKKHGLPVEPRIVAELGPGDSLGAGLAALLTGADHYYAFDVMPYAHTAANLRVLHELVPLFESQTAVPEGIFAPRILSSVEFPQEILTSKRLTTSLARPRVSNIGRATATPGIPFGDIIVNTELNWDQSHPGPEELVDMIFSQAVLEHVDDLQSAYTAMHRWLRRGGVVSHQIDFRSHGFARAWNGHWTYSDPMWALARGRRRWAINREPLSTHLALLAGAGFELAGVAAIHEKSTISREQLAPRFRSMSEDDFTTRGALIQAVKC